MATPYSGYVRTKSRQQAQDERRFGQDRFDGGLDSDTPPVKIAINELALAQNVVCYSDRVEGHYGRVLATDERLPGDGARHWMEQHPVTGRWLLHRGGKMWLSAGRRQREWSEVVAIGPDGSLEASGTLEYPDGTGTIVGGAGDYLTNMVMAGVSAGEQLEISVDDAGAGQFQIVITSPGGGTVSLSDALNYSDTPLSGVALNEYSGSGYSGTVDVATLTSGGLPATGTWTATTITASVDFCLRGLTLENTNNYELWWNVVVSAGTEYINIYKDSAKTNLVASSDTTSSFGKILVNPENGSGISGYYDWPLISPIDGTFGGTSLLFSVSIASIDEKSKIFPYSESGFIVFVRGSNPHNIYVDQMAKKYWFLSLPEGYGTDPIHGDGSGAYSYRYLYSFSRITDPVSGVADSSLNRITGSLVFEGPSNLPNSSMSLDYAAFLSSVPVSSPDPIAMSLLDESGFPIGIGAASYITHISIYRTLDVGVNGINPVTGVANNSELYIWVADVPIYSTEYTDSTSDEILLNRFSGGSTQGENFALRSRFFTPMEKGIGSIRPDFMATVAPQGTRITYCDVAVNPRFIGYYFAGSQFFLTQDPVSDIMNTKDLFVMLCPSSNYTSVTAINIDAGISGISYIPTIQNFEKSSQTVGVKYGQHAFKVNDNSFVSLCSDGTIRVFSASFWGEPLDGDQVHKLVELAQPGAVLLYFRDALYFWYTTDPEATVTDNCLRYGAGSQAGNKWSVIGREHWVWPPVGGGMAAIWEDEDAILRMLAIDDVEDVAFAIEDLPPLRQYEDDLVEDWLAIEGDGAQYLSDLVFPGWETSTLYGIIRSVFGGVVVQFFESAADRAGNVNAVGFTDTLTEVGVAEIMGAIPGSVDVLSLTPSEFIVVPGVRVSGKSQIASPIRFRALTATQQQFICFHQESYVFMRSVYGMPPPVVAAWWYADEILIPTSEQSSVPAGGDIQSFAQVRGRTIQFEMEPQSSGWQLTGWNVKYQTQDMRSANGPWNSVEASLQAELMRDMFSWVLGVSGLINRADPFYAKYSGTVPALILGPNGRAYAQEFTAASMLAYERTVYQYSIMFWVKEPVTGTDATPLSMLSDDGSQIAYITFPDSTHVDIGSFQYEIPETDEWVHYCVTRDDSTFKTYRNGALLGSGELTPGSELAVRTLRIGAQKLYDLRLYAAALSGDAVAYYYNHPKQVP